MWEYTIPGILNMQFSSHQAINIFVHSYKNLEWRHRQEIGLNSHYTFGEEENNFVLKDSIFIRKDYLLVKIRFDELLWIKSEGNYIELHCRDKRHLVRSSLKDILKKLPSQKFIQVHKSYSVNLEFISAIDHRKIRIDDADIPIGRSYVENVLKTLNIEL